MEFRDLKKQYQVLKQEIDAGVIDVMTSGAFILGKPVKELEEKLAAYTGRKHCVAVANGTDALQLSLMAFDIGPGDAVFTSDFTYFASAGSASILGATPVLVDIDLDTFNMSAEDLERRIQAVLAEGRLKPKFIVPVDLFGLPADFTKILPVAEKYGLRILEDGAQGFGGAINGKRACSFGDISTTSFFPAKPLGCYGDGGAIFTDDDEIDARLRSLRAQGKSPEDKYDNREIGMNSRLDTLQAAVLLPKLKAFEDYEVDAVNRVAGIYSAALKDKVVTPHIPEGFLSSWAQYTIRLREARQRDAVQASLKEQGIPSMVYYPKPMHTQLAFAGNKVYVPCPVTEALCNTVLSLPMHPYLDQETVNTVAEALKKAL